MLSHGTELTEVEMRALALMFQRFCAIEIGQHMSNATSRLESEASTLRINTPEPATKLANVHTNS